MPLGDPHLSSDSPSFVLSSVATPIDATSRLIPHVGLESECAGFPSPFASAETFFQPGTLGRSLRRQPHAARRVPPSVGLALFHATARSRPWRLACLRGRLRSVVRART
jgi:hypothetical protein